MEMQVPEYLGQFQGRRCSNTLDNDKFGQREPAKAI